MPSKTARPEGERWFEWPLTPTSIGMTAAELISELYETVTALNMTAAGISRWSLRHVSETSSSTARPDASARNARGRPRIPASSARRPPDT